MLGNFCIGTGTMMVAGLVNQISAGMAISVPQAAQLFTAFAVVCAVSAPLCAAWFAGYSRRAVLVWSLALFAAMHLLATLVDSYALLLVVRGITGLGAAIFTPAAAAVAGQLVAPEKRGQAVGFVFLGWSAASVVGVPLGSYLGAVYHWHVAMAVVGCLTTLTAVAVWWVVPKGLQAAKVDMAAFTGLLRDRRIMPVVGVTVLSGSGLFTMFAYLAPLYRDVVHASATQIPLLFATYGLAGLVGSIAMSKTIDRIGAGRMVTLLLSATCLVMLLWPVSALHISLALMVALLWGAPGFASNGAQQARIVGLAGAMAPVAVAFNSSAIYIGQAIGSVVGGVFYANAPAFDISLVYLPWVALVFTVAALWVSARVK